MILLAALALLGALIFALALARAAARGDRTGIDCRNCSIEEALRQERER